MTNRRQILLVDDTADIIKLVKKRLEEVGFDVRVAMDGDEAIRQVRSKKPDLIILDVMLPKLNGHQVCSMLKQDEQYSNIPIILFTARTSEIDEQLGFEAGADAYVRKPFRSEELLGQVKKLLS